MSNGVVVREGLARFLEHAAEDTAKHVRRKKITPEYMLCEERRHDISTANAKVCFGIGPGGRRDIE